MEMTLFLRFIASSKAILAMRVISSTLYFSVS